jgi:EAL domain-containing protein (putative c-di-GMP-specific phosphodiesterase class I)/sensor domain CHASE-containing protein
MLILACLPLLLPAARASDIAVDDEDARPAVLVLEELRHAWLGQLDELIDTARSLAVADDTYEFVKRPNIPYVDAHYAAEHLAAERIDTVLIINLDGKPLFWRRVNQGGNRGFPDARLFLAELPPLPAPGVAGVPSLAGAATLVHGPKLLVAMPIYAASRPGGARGWLIATRALDAHQWHRYEESAHVPVQLFDPSTSKFSGDEAAALQEPLAPIVRVEATQIRGFMAVSDLQGKPFRVFGVSLVRREAAMESVAASFIARSAPWLVLMVAIAFVAASVAGATGIKRRQSREILYLGPPPTGVVRAPSGTASPDASDSAIAPGNAAFHPAHARDPLRARLAAGNAVFRYQPQIDLQTGQVAGVEALLCVPGLHEFRPAVELAAEIEAVGLGLALVERRLRDACHEQRAWLEKIGHEFPIGVPVSQRSLVNAAFLPLIRSILAENELAPSCLELQVEESALGASASALRSLSKALDSGIVIAIDGFNAAHSNLRLLSILPISKLRVDPYLLLRIGEGPSEALLFDAIIGAARGLGIAVCATGITSPELLSTLLRHGRPLAQGGALAPALAGEEFLKLLRGGKLDPGILPPSGLGDERARQDST